MANDLPTDPHDPRWLPSRRTAVLIGAGFQAFFAVVVWALIAAHPKPADPPLLVRAVLIPEDMVYQDTDWAPREGEQTRPVDVDEIAVATPSRVTNGQQLFAEHCASCHGDQGEGDGPAGVALQPRPRDLTSLAGWKRGVRLSDIFRTTSLGLEGSQMPGFDYLTVEERFALAHSVAGLAPDRPADTPISLDSLDAEFSLSAGTKEPNVVPLRTAMDQLAAEAVPAPPEPAPEKLAELKTAEPRGAALFARVVARPQRVAYLLQTDSSWQRDPDRLKTIATSGAPANGFSAGTAALSPADWSSLHRYLTLRYQTE